MTSLFIRWDVNPVLVHLGSMQIRWYGLLFALSFILGYLVLEKIVFKREGLPVALLDKLATYVFYAPASYLSEPLSILKIWEGGLASHGAAIGILIALWLFVRKSGKTYLWALDRVVIVVALGGAFVRMGNLMNSEIYGHITNLPWGFIFERNGETLPRHPTQIYEALSYLILFFALITLYMRKFKTLKDGKIFGIFLIVLFGGRFLIEFLKQPQVDFEQNMTLNMGQWLSIPFIIAGIGLLWWVNKQSEKVNK